VQRSCRGAEVEWCRCVAEVHRCMCRGAEVSGAELVQSWCKGDSRQGKEVGRMDRCRCRCSRGKRRRVAEMQLFSCSVVQLFSCSVVQLFSCSVVQLCSCAVVQLCSGVEVQRWCRCRGERCRGAEVLHSMCTCAYMHMCRGAEVLRCRGAEVHTD
jgi:hypothetical protein